MEKRGILLLFILIPLISFATADINVYDFYSATCPHCTNVKNSGIMERVDAFDDVTVQQYEISTPGGFNKYEYYHDRIRMAQGVPLAVIECETGEFQHLIGDTPIINELEQAIENCRTGNVPSSSSNIFLYIIVLAVLAAAGYYFYKKSSKKKKN